jgi:carbonic anhydrase/acetyltransferase-like protein (isoleucine patch superfamily)
VIYKVSYFVVGRPEVGEIVNLTTPPNVGDQVKLGNAMFQVTEVIDLIPPRGDFAYLHVTCQPVQEPAAPGRGAAMDLAYHPKNIHPRAYVAPNATLIGDVHVAAGASVWFGCILRGDEAPITIGARTNVQDLTVIHADAGTPCTLGEGATIGHRAVLHSATVEDGALIGIGAIVLNGAVVGREALIGAGALVPEGMHIPPMHLALGVPAQVVRELTSEEIDHMRSVAAQYVARARAFIAASKQGE